MQLLLKNPESANKRLDIQGLRAVAVVSVIIFHTGIALPGGFTGVDVFFVISGYVITSMLLREYESTNKISFSKFFFKRFQRLTPALSIMIICTLFASLLFQSPFGPQQNTAATGLGAMFLSANFVIAHVSGLYFAPTAESNPLLNTWSLSVEEQFYLVFPFILALALFIRKNGINV